MTEPLDKRTKAYKEWAAAQTKEAITPVTNGRIAAMNDLAKRIWDGQGSIPYIERIRRIHNALQEKGYSAQEFELLDLPKG